MSEDRVQGACVASTFVVLQMVVEKDKKIHILYQNPHLCSAYGCRPLKLWFVNESTSNATAEITRLKSEANNLQPFISDTGLKVTFIVFFSMCDMKIENFKWGNSCAMRCPFCRFLQTLFHEDLIFLGDVHAMSDCCISVLHFLIRFFEHFLKVFCFLS